MPIAIKMGFKSWIYYLLIFLIGVILYLPVIFSFGLFAPVHILIVWLMHNNFLSMVTYRRVPIAGKITLPVVACIGQNVFVLVYFAFKENLTLDFLQRFVFSWIGLILLLVTATELFILRKCYTAKVLGSLRD